MFVRACQFDDITAGSARQVRIGGHTLALIRIDDDVYALGDRCTHEDISLSEGEVEGRQIECWKHGSVFDVDTGEPQCLPATEPTPTYAVEVRDGEVFVDIGDV